MKKNSGTYNKYCIVPACKNNNRTDPDKVYFNVPKDALVRKKWCKAIGRDNVSCLSTLFCCEDHFDIERDTNNYIQYKLMTEHGQKVSLKLNKGVVPYIFPWHKKDEVSSLDGENAEKKRRVALVEDDLAAAALTEAGLSKTRPSIMSISKTVPSAASVPNTIDVTLKTSDSNIDGEAASSIVSNIHGILQLDKAVQVNVHYRSKSINVNLTAKKNNIALSPISVPSENLSLSLLNSAPSSAPKRKLFPDSHSDIISVTSVNSESSVISSHSKEQEHSLSDTSDLVDESESDSQFKSLMRSGTLIAMEKEPKMFLGLPKNSYYLIKLLSENIPLSTVDILITLRKIKLNETFSLLAVHFGYSQSAISRIFSKSIVPISEKMKEFIIWPTPSQIYEKLPISFRARYDNVYVL